MEFELICLECKHYNMEDNNCKAFPLEIPEIIYIGLDDHSEPLPSFYF